MIGLILLGILAVFAAVILVRTLTFKPKAQPKISEEEVSFDKDGAVNALAELVKCRTVSYSDHSKEDDAEFEKLIAKLPGLYPNVFGACEFQQLPDRGLLFKWPGKAAGNPAVMMAHYDVVPVNEDQWDKPAFDAIVEDGVMWGRGTLDTKVTFNGVLFAADHLIAQGFCPEHDVYFAFSGGEEVNGKGAQYIVDFFHKNHIHPALVLDEGGAVVDNVFPGVKGDCALIGTAEKGIMNVEFKAKSNGGHSSTPPVHTIVGELSQAVVNVEKKPFKRHLTKPVKEMLDTLGRHSGFGYKILFANMWLFEGLFDLVCKRSGGELNAMVRTTCAVTKMEGSKAYNVIPPTANVGMNLRLMGGDTVESAKAYLEKVVNNPKIEVSVVNGTDPSPDSDTSCKEWKLLCQAVADTWKGAILSPYLMMAASDSRHYSRITDRVYKFSAMKMSKEERGMIHGNNERVPVETLVRAVEFYVRLMTSGI